jgi:hypothetical protein
MILKNMDAVLSFVSSSLYPLLAVPEDPEAVLQALEVS